VTQDALAPLEALYRTRYVYATGVPAPAVVGAPQLTTICALPGVTTMLVGPFGGVADGVALVTGVEAAEVPPAFIDWTVKVVAEFDNPVIVQARNVVMQVCKVEAVTL
jgi:hypothetical protein